MNNQHPAEAARTVRLYERAEQLRAAMLRTPGLLERVEAGRRAAEGGETLDLTDVERAIAPDE